MNKTEAENTVTIGDPMPLLASISAPGGSFEVTMTWASGTRVGSGDIVDLAPVILTHKFYKPLRDDADLFRTVHIIEDGAAIAWGADDAIDMAASTIERLAEETMTTEAFGEWLKHNNLTFDAAALALGVSRRLVAYYAGGRPIPRYIALACRTLNSELAPKLGPRLIKAAQQAGAIARGEEAVSRARLAAAAKPKTKGLVPKTAGKLKRPKQKAKPKTPRWKA
jgi:hypothetical protein